MPMVSLKLMAGAARDMVSRLPPVSFYRYFNFVVNFRMLHKSAATP